MTIDVATTPYGPPAHEALAVRGRRDVDGHLLPIVRTARDTGAMVAFNLDR